jgi:hypothetical protein
MAAAFATVTALNSQAADQSELTPHQKAESDWLTAQIAVGSQSFAPIPFPVPAPKARPARSTRIETRYQRAESDWLTKERDLTDGDTTPISPPSFNAPANVAGR